MDRRLSIVGSEAAKSSPSAILRVEAPTAPRRVKEAFLSFLLVPALGLCGCDWKWGLFSPPPGQEEARGLPIRSGPAEDPLHKDAKDQHIEQLESEVRALRSRVEELGGRSQRLAEEVRRLKFLNDQLKKQLEAVGDAPRQRDKYKAQAERLQLEVRRLREQIKELERILKSEAPGDKGVPPVCLGSAGETCLAGRQAPVAPTDRELS